VGYPQGGAGMAIISAKKVIVKLLDGTVIKGSVTARGKIRLSDLFNETENPFIIMFDIQTQEKLGKVLFINKNQIVWVSPLDQV